MTEPALTAHADPEAMAASLAARLVGALSQAVADRGAASLVLSGGSTPKPLYRRMAQMHAPWQDVSVTLADERWVPPAHEASNESLVRANLLTGHARAARFVPLKTEADLPGMAVPDVARRLNALARPFDLVVLGMGADGHTASLFPGARGLAEALGEDASACAAIRPDPLPPEAPYPRMTLTARTLLDSRRVVLLIAGSSKRAVYEEALAGSDPQAMPVRAILHQDRTPVEVHWAP